MRASLQGRAAAARLVSAGYALAGSLAALAGIIQPVDPAAARDAAPALSLPLDCRLGQDCFIQNYVDVDAGPGIADFTCGGATYDGHKGTDFRVLSAKAGEGVPVLSAAPGRVLRLRDGVRDRLLRDYPSKREMRALTANRECGNGVVIEHGGGWVSQYCHLRRGSIRVKRGDKVARGAVLGLVGYSGRADFAHVHISLRHNNRIVDPFTGRRIDGSTGGRIDAAALDCRKGARQPGARSLWQPALHDALRHSAHTILAVGFTAAPPDHNQMERDHDLPAVEPKSGALIYYGRFMNLEAGDRLRFEITGPGRFTIARMTEPLKRRKAVFVSYVGKRLKARRWPAGTYEGRVTVVRRDGTEGATAVEWLTLR